MRPTRTDNSVNDDHSANMLFGREEEAETATANNSAGTRHCSNLMTHSKRNKCSAIFKFAPEILSLRWSSERERQNDEWQYDPREV